MAEIKQPAEDLVYAFDFSSRLGDETIVSIEAATVLARGLVAEIQPLVIADKAAEGQSARVRLQGGTDGETYLVTLRIADTGAQVYELDAEFAVAQQAFVVPDGGSDYLSAQAFVDRIGLDEALALTDLQGQGRIDASRLLTALGDAQAEVDGYLAGRYAVPLGTVPPVIAAIVFDLAVARLWRANLPEGVADRRDRAQRQLVDIAKGVMTLPGAAGLPATADNVTPVLFQPGETRLFGRGRLQDF